MAQSFLRAVCMLLSPLLWLVASGAIADDPPPDAKQRAVDLPLLKLQPAKRVAGAAIELPAKDLAPAEAAVNVPQASVPQAADSSERSSIRASIQLVEAGFAAGELLDTVEPDRVRWRSPWFTQPLDFPIQAVNSIQFSMPETPVSAAGQLCFELAGNDTLFGDLVEMTEDYLHVSTQRFGMIAIRKDQVQRFYRWRGGNELIFLGPEGLAGWTTAASGGWHEEGGHLFTDVASASIARDFALPEKSIIEFELSWSAAPDFVMGFAVDANDQAMKNAFRMEVWESKLVVTRELKESADIMELQEEVKAQGRAHFQMYLDQRAGKLTIFSASGVMLGQLEVAQSTPEIFGGIRLLNQRGNVRLERLRISRWESGVPQALDTNRDRVLLTDGTNLQGSIIAFDPANQRITVQDGEKETVVRIEDVADVIAGRVKSASERPLRIALLDGSRVSGAVQKLGRSEILLTTSAIRDPVAIRTADLRSIVVLKHDAAVVEPQRPGPIGTLRIPLSSPDTQLRGSLEDAVASSDASCLHWKPIGGASASPLKNDVHGAISYREPVAAPAATVPPPGNPQPRNPQPRNQNLLGGLVQALLGAEPNSQPVAGRSSERRFLHLLSGDTIPCTIVSIDEQGVTIKSDVAESTFVPHDKIKAAELTAVTSVPKISRTKRERLLTLPRMQKASPPMHVICSRNGDFLRGNIVSMDQQKLRVEVRLETRELPREVVTQILWLHPSVSPAQSKVEKEPITSPLEKPAGIRIQTLRSDGIRLTFYADRFLESAFSGTSEVLGACRAEMAQIDRVLIGDEIEKAAADLDYQKWRLNDAIEPKFVSADSASTDGGSPGSAGTDSPLVGKPAPDFKLELLDGTTFKLQDRRGKIVVLDFWATWCGPCIQAMPEVERVVGEFSDRGVELIAVNLEESAAQIRSTLERHKLHPTVALDIDGVVAQRYQATAIPQTVIIDATGNISRLFVGGGPRFADQLRASLGELTKKSQQ